MSFWQSHGRDGSAGGMIRRAALVLSAAACLGSPAAAVPGGQLGTLALGLYRCETGGDALGPTGVRVSEADFEVINASSYRVGEAIGSYLLTGDRAVMTSGPRRGERFRRLSRGFLRKTLPGGTDGELRCVLAGRNNS